MPFPDQLQTVGRCCPKIIGCTDPGHGEQITFAIQQRDMCPHPGNDAPLLHQLLDRFMMPAMADLLAAVTKSNLSVA